MPCGGPVEPAARGRTKANSSVAPNEALRGPACHDEAKFERGSSLESREPETRSIKKRQSAQSFHRGYIERAPRSRRRARGAWIIKSARWWITGRATRTQRPGTQNMLHPESGCRIRRRTADVLDWHAECPQCKRPVIGFDETPIQSSATRSPIGVCSRAPARGACSIARTRSTQRTCARPSPQTRPGLCGLDSAKRPSMRVWTVGSPSGRLSSVLSPYGRGPECSWAV